MNYNKILIEGLDRLGKSLLSKNIQNEHGFFQSIHFGKPQRTKFYAEYKRQFPFITFSEEEMYQRKSFDNMFELLNSGAKIILDRAHLGENVYAPIYRGYAGDYVYDLELLHGMDKRDDALLVLLTEDFKCSKHFTDDGLSFDITKREQEQELFLTAFAKSNFRNKKIVCVTDKKTGQFRDSYDILEEVLF